MHPKGHIEWWFPIGNKIVSSKCNDWLRRKSLIHYLSHSSLFCSPLKWNCAASPRDISSFSTATFAYRRLISHRWEDSRRNFCSFSAMSALPRWLFVKKRQLTTHQKLVSRIFSRLISFFYEEMTTYENTWWIDDLLAHFHLAMIPAVPPADRPVQEKPRNFVFPHTRIFFVPTECDGSFSWLERYQLWAVFCSVKGKTISWRILMDRNLLECVYFSVVRVLQRCNCVFFHSSTWIIWSQWTTWKHTLTKQCLPLTYFLLLPSIFTGF